jgi:hypothetical protein
MKWAIIAVVALVVLGGVGYGIYELTSLPEDAEEWWDEKKLENFPTQAAREIEDMEKRLSELKDTRKELLVDKAKLTGGEKFGDANFSSADSGFMTLYGYDARIKAYNDAGTSLGNSYKEAAKAGGGAVSSDTGVSELPDDAEIAVNFTHPKTDKTINDKLTAANVLAVLEEIAADVETMEYERGLVQESIADYETVIGEVDTTIEAQEAALKEFKQEVKKIEAQLKMIKVKEDLAEINKAIAGEESDSELGELIAQYEKKKKDFAARQTVAEGSTKETKSLDDLAKGGTKKGNANKYLK